MLKRHCLCLLALAACAAASCAQAPPISLPAEVRGRSGELVAVTAETKGKSVAWLCLDEGLCLVPSSALRDQRTTYAVAPRPGRYRVRAITCVEGELSEWASSTVVIEETAGRERAAARSGPMWVVVIEETARRTPEQAAVLADAGVARYVREKGWRVRVADRDARDSRRQAPADLKPYVERARGKRLPYLFVVDAEGHARHEGPLPAGAAGLLEILKKVGG